MKYWITAGLMVLVCAGCFGLGNNDECKVTYESVTKCADKKAEASCVRAARGGGASHYVCVWTTVKNGTVPKCQPSNQKTICVN